VSTAVRAKQDGQLQIRTRLKALGMLGLWFPGPESPLTSSQVHINMLGKILDEKWTRFSEVAGAQSATLVQIDFFGAWKELGWSGVSDDTFDVEIAVR
jgi:hypothetical protein